MYIPTLYVFTVSCVGGSKDFEYFILRNLAACFMSVLYGS